ncbi:hypothetical protein BZG36_04637 [Bifiguratus adelaidae]|uniref:HTH APSES-type domain-containing protein n=1 Tax=Bifiguratus adelaidae TaxID=1938954 RepID=A0A261XUZ3_9FUNG|nr:hypothetical protein BZG36_04637 [Bifiguratus adelaidae]
MSKVLAAAINAISGHTRQRSRTAAQATSDSENDADHEIADDEGTHDRASGSEMESDTSRASTPISNPLPIPIHPNDAKDKVFTAILKALVKMGNKPSSPRELANCIVKYRYATLGGATPYATVSSRISQHFKRAAEHNPPRQPLLAKHVDERHTRKINYSLVTDAEQFPDQTERLGTPLVPPRTATPPLKAAQSSEAVWPARRQGSGVQTRSGKDHAQDEREGSPASNPSLTSSHRSSISSSSDSPLSDHEGSGKRSHPRIKHSNETVHDLSLNHKQDDGIQDIATKRSTRLSALQRRQPPRTRAHQSPQESQRRSGGKVKPANHLREQSPEVDIAADDSDDAEPPSTTLRSQKRSSKRRKLMDDDEDGDIKVDDTTESDTNSQRSPALRPTRYNDPSALSRGGKLRRPITKDTEENRTTGTPSEDQEGRTSDIEVDVVEDFAHPGRKSINPAEDDSDMEGNDFAEEMLRQDAFEDLEVGGPEGSQRRKSSRVTFKDSNHEAPSHPYDANTRSSSLGHRKSSFSLHTNLPAFSESEFWANYRVAPDMDSDLLSQSHPSQYHIPPPPYISHRDSITLGLSTPEAMDISELDQYFPELGDVDNSSNDTHRRKSESHPRATRRRSSVQDKSNMKNSPLQSINVASQPTEQASPSRSSTRSVRKDLSTLQEAGDESEVETHKAEDQSFSIVPRTFGTMIVLELLSADLKTLHPLRFVASTDGSSESMAKRTRRRSSIDTGRHAEVSSADLGVGYLDEGYVNATILRKVAGWEVLDDDQDAKELGDSVVHLRHGPEECRGAWVPLLKARELYKVYEISHLKGMDAFFSDKPSIALETSVHTQRTQPELVPPQGIPPEPLTTLIKEAIVQPTQDPKENPSTSVGPRPGKLPVRTEARPQLSISTHPPEFPNIPMAPLSVPAISQELLDSIGTTEKVAPIVQTYPPIFATVIDGTPTYVALLSRAHGFAKEGKLLRMVDNNYVNATQLLMAGGVETDTERNIILSLEVGRVRIRKRDSGLFGTWVPLHRAKALASTCSVDHKLGPFLEEDLGNFFPSPLPLTVPDKLETPFSVASAGFFGHSRTSPDVLSPSSAGNLRLQKYFEYPDRALRLGHKPPMLGHFEDDTPEKRKKVSVVEKGTANGNNMQAEEMASDNNETDTDVEVKETAAKRPNHSNLRHSWLPQHPKGDAKPGEKAKGQKGEGKRKGGQEKEDDEEIDIGGSDCDDDLR